MMSFISFSYISNAACLNQSQNMTDDSVCYKM